MNFARRDVGRFQIGDRDEPDELSGSVLMALNSNDSVIGCALFDEASGVLQLARDEPKVDMDVISRFVAHGHPSLILISSRAPKELRDGIHDCHGHSVRTISSSKFSASYALEKLTDLRVPLPTSLGFPSQISSQDRIRKQHHSNSIVGATPAATATEHDPNLNHIRQESIGCAGAILSELLRGSLSSNQGPSEGVGTGMRRIEGFSLSHFVSITPETLNSLQIFQGEHPSDQQWAINRYTALRADSLSIYGLFCSLAHTSQGKTKLRELLLRPVFDLEVIRSRQEATYLLLHPENRDRKDHIAETLRKTKNVASYIFSLRKGVTFSQGGQDFSASVWANVRTFVSQALKLRDHVNTLRGVNDCCLIRNVSLKLDEQSLLAAGGLLHDTIDFDRAHIRGLSMIRAGIDEELDRLLRQYDGLNDLLAKVAQSATNVTPTRAARNVWTCAFLPQLGFLLAINQHSEHSANEITSQVTTDSRWEQMFFADGIVYYKNDDMRLLDEQFGDVYCSIADREIEILQRLATQLLQYEDALLSASAACGDIDAVLAIALVAEKYRWNAPKLTTSSAIAIHQGRHPLQELLSQPFIANDCHLGDVQHTSGSESIGRCLVFTGPNQSGKSVYLKQVALIVYLAHIGSFVPAEAAVIGLTDQILTRLSAHESVCKHESAFAIDLGQLLRLIQHSTSRSLLVIDEFGKGTNPDDGSGLLAACISHFQSMSSKAPRCLLATHLREYFEGVHFFPNQDLQLAHLKVAGTLDSNIAGASITYLFQLCQGYGSSSLGSSCAAAHGVPQPIVERSEHLVSLLDQDEDISVPCAKLSASDEAKLQKAEHVARRFIEEDFHTTGGHRMTSHDLRHTLARVVEDDGV